MSDKLEELATMVREEIQRRETGFWERRLQLVRVTNRIEAELGGPHRTAPPPSACRHKRTNTFGEPSAAWPPKGTEICLDCGARWEP